MSKVPSHSPSSIWQTQGWPAIPSMQGAIKTEVCIVGAGIAGLTSAYLLAREGRQVTLVDASGPGQGETGNTTAHLASAIDDHFSELEQLFGQERSRLAADSHRAAIDLIESICQSEGIECGFERVDAYLFAPPGDTSDFIDKEFAASLRAGFTDCEKLDSVPLPSFRTGRCLRYRQQAQIDPLAYLRGLLKAFLAHGGTMINNFEVNHIDEGKPLLVSSASGALIEADAVIVATNTPINDRFTMHTKQAPYRTYVLAMEIEAQAVPRALYWDTLDPYHYVRLHDIDDERTVLIAGGEDHKVGQEEHPEAHFGRLETWTRQHFPEAGRILKRWSGQVLEPVDSLAFIGRNPGSQHIYIATGDSGNGMTHFTIAGRLLSDLIQERSNPWESLYDPSRLNLHVTSLREFLTENANVALQYRDYLTPGDVESVDEIAAGDAGIIRQGVQKIAVYRDESGQLHSFSATCPHLLGVVRWNREAQTWDCPCHGSRFDVQGRVVNGPATQDLEAHVWPKKDSKVEHQPARERERPRPGASL